MKQLAEKAGRMGIVLLIGFFSLGPCLAASLDAGDRQRSHGSLGLDPAFQSLSAGNVYVDPRLTNIRQTALEQAAQQSQDHPHTKIQIAVLAHLPDPSRSVEQYTETLHHALGLGKNGLVVAVLGGPVPSVAVATSGLTQHQKARLAREFNPRIAADPSAGTAALAQAVASGINGKEYQSASIIWIVFLVVLIVAAWLLLAVSRSRTRRLAQARVPVDALRVDVLGEIENLDGEVLPNDNVHSDQIRALRQSADAKFEQAVRILNRASEVSDLDRSEVLLREAQSDVQQARRFLATPDKADALRQDRALSAGSGSELGSRTDSGNGYHGDDQS